MTQRNGKVIPCAEQQPPFRDRAECCGESGERGGSQKIQSAEPNKRPFAAERRKAERRACEHAHGQSGEEREQRRPCGIHAAEQRGESKPPLSDFCAAEPRRREQRHPVHQHVREKQHIEIHDHRRSPLSFGTFILPRQARQVMPKTGSAKKQKNCPKPLHL